MKKSQQALSLLTIALGFCIAHAQTTDSQKDSTVVLKPRIFPLPIFFYTPETGTAGGAAALLLYRDTLSARASSIALSVIYTEKKQFIGEIGGDQYFSGGEYRLLTDVLFQRFPNKFFGIGNNTAESEEEDYTPQSIDLSAVLYKNIRTHINVGPTFRYGNVAMREAKPGGLLASQLYTGSSGGTVSGLGIVANWDSRDNTFSARTGSFYQISALFYEGAFGSDFNYSDVTIDTRNYYELVPGQVLAVQGAAEIIGGSPPFQRLAKFGGQNLVRGYYDGRYRDKSGIVLQTEYRLPVWWRFGIVGFAGIGQVAEKITNLALNRFWCAGGVGLRFYWNPEERISLRLDYGVGNNSNGMYITVNEAF